MKKTNAKANNETVRNSETVREELAIVCEKYSIARIKHDTAIENGKAVTKKLIDELGELGKKCEELANEFKTASRNEFYARCKEAENPMQSFFAIYNYEVVSVVDEAVSKENPAFAKRTIVSKNQTPNIYQFEKEIGIESDKIATQKGFVNKLGRELAIKVAETLGCKNAVETTIAPENKKAEELAFTKKTRGDKRSALLCSLQDVVDAMYYELDENTGINSIVCDTTDEAYLNYCFTRKGKDRLSIKVLRDGGLAFVITDMIHRAVIGANYSVTGYKENK